MSAGFPSLRLRRLRRTPALRAMVRETHLRPAQLVCPLFVEHGEGRRTPIASMPGVSRFTVDGLVEEARSLLALEVAAVLLFGIPARKDPAGEESWDDDGIVQRAVRELKAATPELVVITDVCLCEYTDHGHCGLVDGEGALRNDATLEVLGRIAESHARAGADVVAPSGMVDGMVRAIRSRLDVAGFTETAILSYAVKYASSFYGPFREAAEGAPAFGDRRAHQMDPANAREALREAALDLEEGADLLMVKPGLPYLDVIHRLRQAHPETPLAAYNVSGEYSMLKAAAERGWLDPRSAALEVLVALVRAGADLVITYHAKEAAAWLLEEGRRGTVAGSDAGEPLP
ncbi:MAG TPA: porphobilinogen synthase [Thermoanaerobaculia bacterium]|nr:porphobilinogen synthase [Thermoanaerobaculia bacterium]